MNIKLAAVHDDGRLWLERWVGPN